MSLKVYQWERHKFPREARINVKYEWRAPLTRALSKRLGVGRPLYAACDKRNEGGRALGGGGGLYIGPDIRLPSSRHECALGTILHEIAHHRDKEKYDGWGHRATFKKSLIAVYCEYKHILPAAAAEALREIKDRRAKAERNRKAWERKERASAEAKAKRKTAAYKIARVEARIKNLDRRIRHLETRRKSARRSLAALRRWENKKGVATNG